MSGGVDSSVAAALLKNEGYDVTGVFMKNWSGKEFGIEGNCPWEQDQADVMAVCKILNIPFRSYNFEKQYRESVISYFFEELKAGRTPNPDVMCNKEIKFKHFLEKSLGMGADLIATGHYARVRYDAKTKNYELLKGLDANKDQSYFLYNLDQQQLAKVLFPIGEYTKPEIRKLAAKFRLPVAKKPDSQGICFIGEINVKQLIKSRLKPKQGDIKDLDSGKTIGKHEGVQFYTIGQREGIGIGGAGEPYYVIGKHAGSNTLVVAKGKQNPALFNRAVKFTSPHFIAKNFDGKSLSAAIRYRQKASRGKLSEDGTFVFDTPQRAVASGQSIVFYQNEKVLGGAIIA